MIAQLLSPPYILFAVTFVLMLGIGLIEAVGLGMGHLGLEADIPELESGSFLGWLGLASGLPVLVWLTSFLACFTFAGLALQQVAEAVLGQPLHWGLAAIGASTGGLFANAFCAGFLARLIPEYESTVIDSEALLRRRATVLEGTASRGAPARAKVIDQHGQAHYVMVEPHEDSDVVTSGETGLLVRREGPLFFLLPEVSHPLTTV